MVLKFETTKTKSEADWTLSLTFSDTDDWYPFPLTLFKQDISTEIYCMPALFLMQLLELWGGMK